MEALSLHFVNTSTLCGVAVLPRLRAEGLELERRQGEDARTARPRSAFPADIRSTGLQTLSCSRLQNSNRSTWHPSSLERCSAKWSRSSQNEATSEHKKSASRHLRQRKSEMAQERYHVSYLHKAISLFAPGEGKKSAPFHLRPTAHTEVSSVCVENGECFAHFDTGRMYLFTPGGSLHAAANKPLLTTRDVAPLRRAAAGGFPSAPPAPALPWTQGPGREAAS